MSIATDVRIVDGLGREGRALSRLNQPLVDIQAPGIPDASLHPAPASSHSDSEAIRSIQRNSVRHISHENIGQVIDRVRIP